jgi:hypothetical protein
VRYGQMAYPLKDLKRIDQRDLLLGWRLMFHTRIIHVFDVYSSWKNVWLKPGKPASPPGLKPCDLRRAISVSTVAANGMFHQPHVGYVIATYGEQESGGAPVEFNGTPTQRMMQPATAQAIRAAMWSTVDYGSAFYGLPAQRITGAISTTVASMKAASPAQR